MSVRMSHAHTHTHTHKHTRTHTHTHHTHTHTNTHTHAHTHTHAIIHAIKSNKFIHEFKRGAQRSRNHPTPAITSQGMSKSTGTFLGIAGRPRGTRGWGLRQFGCIGVAECAIEATSEIVRALAACVCSISSVSEMSEIVRFRRSFTTRGHRGASGVDRPLLGCLLYGFVTESRWATNESVNSVALAHVISRVIANAASKLIRLRLCVDEI